MSTYIIQVPYDSGRKDVRMGNGPTHILRHAARLQGTAVESIQVEESAFELGTTLRLLRALCQKVTQARRASCFPLVLAGGCVTSVGTLSALTSGGVCVIWLDAHADFNTPDSTVSGFIDGMALAMVAGRCWRNLTNSIAGFQPVPESNVVLIGARELDPEERRLLDTSEITSIDTGTIRSLGAERALGDALSKIKPEQVYLHIDLDVLDRAEACANEFSTSGGLTIAELLEIVHVVSGKWSIAAAAITAYDPAYDKDGKALRAATALVYELLALPCIAAS